jgi:hypothetical protein
MRFPKASSPIRVGTAIEDSEKKSVKATCIAFDLLRLKASKRPLSNTIKVPQMMIIRITINNNDYISPRTIPFQYIITIDK